MIATDFEFNNQKASDYDLIICSFDGEIQTATGGEIEFNTVKAPDSDKFTFYGAQYSSVLEWRFSIIKKPCVYSNDPYFSTFEERQIFKWLGKRDGYHYLRFLQDDVEEDIYYNVKISVSPHQIYGKTVGYDLVVTSDSTFGYSSLIIKRATINKEKPLNLYIDNDTNNYLLPEIYITGLGDFYISNENDPERNITKGKMTKFVDIKSTDKIYMNSEHGIVLGILTEKFVSWNFLRLLDGKNIIVTDSENNITLEFRYREVRRVVI